MRVGRSMRLALLVLFIATALTYGCIEHPTNNPESASQAKSSDMRGCIINKNPLYCLPPLLKDFDPAKHLAYRKPVTLVQDEYGLGLLPTGKRLQVVIPCPAPQSKLTSAEVVELNIDMFDGVVPPWNLSNAHCNAEYSSSSGQLTVNLGWAEDPKQFTKRLSFDTTELHSASKAVTLPEGVIHIRVVRQKVIPKLWDLGSRSKEALLVVLWSSTGHEPRG